MKTEIINGLVLAGGYSQRMKQNKADLSYYQKPQYQHVYDLLKPFCTEVFISCKKNQYFPYPCIFDRENEGEIGPVASLLAAFGTHKTAWLVVAIDYPFFSTNEIQKLLVERDVSKSASVYYNVITDFFEPYLGIYETSFEEILTEEVKKNNHSLQKMLKNNDIKKIQITDNQCFININTFDEYLWAKNKIQNSIL